jgi:Na+-transporting NADH:ubiquinone oxidoreductase subunit C
MQGDSTLKTIGIAAALCVVCSVFVSAAAVSLKPLQDENKALDLKTNLLSSAGLVQAGATKDEINEAYKKIETKIVDLATGQYVDGVDPDQYDQRSASKDPAQNIKIEKSDDLARIKYREKLSKVFLVKEDGRTTQIILPIRGKGLWSTLWGFVSLKPDTRTVVGLSFYEHGETPGLGGEVDNAKWKASWIGKKILDENFAPKFSLSKIKAVPGSPGAEYKVDALSGATLTSHGIQSLILYWFGDNGFGPYLQQLRTQGI